MAYDFFGSSSDSTNILTIDGPTVELPDASYIRDAALERDGMDLILDGPNGTVTVEGYFAAESAPDLTAEGGLVLILRRRLHVHLQGPHGQGPCGQGRRLWLPWPLWLPWHRMAAMVGAACTDFVGVSIWTADR